MKRKYIKIPVICLTIALASCSLYGCAKNNSSQANTSSAKSDSKADDDSDSDAYTEEAVKANAEFTPTKEYTDEELSEEYDEDESVAITFNGESAKADSDYVLVEDGKVTIKKSGTYVLSGDYKGQVVVDSDDEDLVRIVLSNTNIESENSSAIFVKKASEVILTIKDGTENTISDAEKYSEDAENNKEKAAIYSKDDLTINGKGSLSVNGNYNHGIQSKDNLIIVSGDINIKSKGNSIVGKDCVVIKDGNIVIDSQGKGIKATSTKAEKGYVYIQGGTINITAEDDGNGALDYNSSYKMNGGTLIAAGSSGMSMTPSEGQNSVNVYLDNTYSDTNIVIKDSQGNELVNYTPAKKFSSFVYSGSNLTTGETYTVYANGEQVETFTVNDTVTKAGNESAGRGSFGPQGGKMQKDVTANKQS